MQIILATHLGGSQRPFSLVVYLWFVLGTYMVWVKQQGISWRAIFLVCCLHQANYGPPMVLGNAHEGSCAVQPGLGILWDD